MLRPNSAVNGLRGFGSWYNTSLRLLADLVDCFPGEDVHPRNLAQFVERAKEASFSLYWSLDLRYWSPKPINEPLLHLLWLTERKGLEAPLEALAQLLASTIAREHDEPAAVATLGKHGSTVNLTVWKDHRVVNIKSVAATERSMIKELGVGRGNVPFCHLIFVPPPDGRVPVRLARRFHRVVLVTDNPDLKRVPLQTGDLRAILKAEVFKNGDELPYYSAVVPTVVINPRPPQSTPESTARGDSALQRAVVAWWSAGHFHTAPVHDDDFDGSNPDPYWRLRRDLCRLPLDLDQIAEHWKNMEPGWEFPAGSLVDQVGNEAISRWARAVTNRQVGLALSGGGASSYHLIPLIKEIMEKGVPIDLVGGVSGGALLGAYYCARGCAGLSLAVEHGPQFTWYALASVLDSRAIQYKVDYDLEAVRVENLPIRFVAITTKLPGKGPPRGCAVVEGTVGEAVRLSGSAPIEFGRTMKGDARYTDGASATLIPARALRDFGADIVFACNSISGPASSNPLGDLFAKTWRPMRGAASLLSRHAPLVGRIVDAWVSAAYLVAQSSRRVATDASEYAEPESERVPLLDSIQFSDAAKLAHWNQPRPLKAAIKARPGGSSSAVDRFELRWQLSKRSPMLSEVPSPKRSGKGRRRSHRPLARTPAPPRKQL